MAYTCYVTLLSIVVLSPRGANTATAFMSGLRICSQEASPARCKEPRAASMEPNGTASSQQAHSGAHAAAPAVTSAYGPRPAAPPHRGPPLQRRAGFRYPPGTPPAAAQFISPWHHAAADAAPPLEPLPSPIHMAVPVDLNPPASIAPVRADPITDPIADPIAATAAAAAPAPSPRAAAPRHSLPLAGPPPNPADTGNPEDGGAAHPTTAAAAPSGDGPPAARLTAPSSAPIADGPEPPHSLEAAQVVVRPFQVWSPRDLAEAFAGRVQDIEIRAHLDLTALAVGVNRDTADVPEPHAIDPLDPVRQLALFYAFPPFRSVRVRLVTSGPAGCGAVSLRAALAPPCARLELAGWLCAVQPCMAVVAGAVVADVAQHACARTL